jgi:CRP-like cAMP-binding protein
MSDDGKEVILNVLGRGEIFGEIALLDGKERTASATAKEESHLLVIDRHDFIPFLETHGEVAARLMGVLCARVRWVSQCYEEALFMNLPARLAKKLLFLADSHGSHGADGIRIDFKLSQRDLGKMTGVSRESINKQIRSWQERGLVAVDQGYLTIKDRRRLERIVTPF